MSATALPSNLTECRGKLSYVTRPDAEKAWAALRNQYLTIYHCKACGGFHLGRSSARQKASS